jgi:hypothetical protein
MYRRFEFEGDIHTSLECVPLAVRRKLDLAGLKISLSGWQILPRADRLTLCHLPVDSDEEIGVYREVMLSCCERASVPLTVLDDPSASERIWNAPSVPSPLLDRIRSLGVSLPDLVWNGLDEEVRYALVKLANPKRKEGKLPALLVELGLRTGTAPALTPDVVVCEATVPASRS